MSEDMRVPEPVPPPAGGHHDRIPVRSTAHRRRRPATGAGAVAAQRAPALESGQPGDELAPVWTDRDLGWLEFNRRVLAEALDDRTPLLERAKFLAIFTSNLDEFFMKRIAVLREDGTADGQRRVAEI